MEVHITVFSQNTPLLESIQQGIFRYTPARQTLRLAGISSISQLGLLGVCKFDAPGQGKEHGLFSPGEVFFATTFAIRHHPNQVPSAMAYYL